MEDRKAEAARLEALGADHDARIIAMTDKEEELGFAVAKVENGTLFIYKMGVTGKDDPTVTPPDFESVFVLDTLMRSAASYGEANGAGRIETAFPDFAGFFEQRGFDVDETHAEAPMSLIVHYS